MPLLSWKHALFLFQRISRTRTTMSDVIKKVSRVSLFLLDNFANGFRRCQIDLFFNEMGLPYVTVKDFHQLVLFLSRIVRKISASRAKSHQSKGFSMTLVALQMEINLRSIHKILVQCVCCVIIVVGGVAVFCWFACPQRVF